MFTPRYSWNIAEVGVKHQSKHMIDWLIFCVQCHFQQYFNYIMATSFSGGRNRSTRREPPTMGKQLVNFNHSTQREPPTMGKQLVNFNHLWLQVECTLFSNLQRRVRTHAVLVIGLFELLGNPTHWATRALASIHMSI